MNIKVYLCITLVICSLPHSIKATNQYPDRLFNDNEQYNLLTHWAYPSPLERYYIKLRTKSPFTMLSTANYRGFIATWLVEDNKFYLTKITIEDASIPLDIIFGKKLIEGRVHVSWLTGYVECYSDSSSLLLKIYKGQIQKITKNLQHHDIVDTYYRLMNKLDLVIGRSLRTPTPEEAHALQLAAEAIERIREAAIERKLAPLRRAQKDAREQAYRIYQALDGFEQIAEQFVVKQYFLGNIILGTYSLIMNVHKKHAYLVDSAEWSNPVNDGNAEYTWHDFLSTYQQVQHVVSSHVWLHDWKLAGGKRQIEAQISGRMPHAAADIDLEFFGTSAWKHKGLQGVPQYEVLLRIEGNWCATIFFGDDDENALIINASSSFDGPYWLDRMEFFYHPTQDVPEYVVVTPDGEWIQNTKAK
jgi:hypothetical protein